MSRIRISEDGEFEVGGRAYHIPEDLPPRTLAVYRTLLRPIPDIRGGTRLSPERRAASEAYLSRRAAAGIIPGFDLSVSASVPAGDIRAIHRWIARHRLAGSAG